GRTAAAGAHGFQLAAGRRTADSHRRCRDSRAGRLDDPRVPAAGRGAVASVLVGGPAAGRGGLAQCPRVADLGRGADRPCGRSIHGAVGADGDAVRQEERWIASRQVPLRLRFYEGAGRGGPTVVALHGLGTAVDVLRDAVPGFDPFARIAAEGFNVVGMDWPGHGRSGGRRGRLTYRLAMDAVADAGDAAAREWGGPVGVFGTALGGVLGFYAALEDERVVAVACHNVLDLRDVHPVLQRTRQGLLLPLAGRLRRWEALPEYVRVPTSAVVAASDLAADPDLSRVLRRHDQSVRSYDMGSLTALFLTPEDKPAVEAQTTPTFVAVGTGDRVLPETASRAFVSRLTCESQLWVLPGGGHQLLLEHPEALVPQVAQFLRKHLM
ncbi:MAG: alpha/beta fold hydrolase, partial [Nitriliruptorales bacterium]|nr:alpha/beta fold hydrolase [Nitriliruptorales bacterium]